MILIKPDYDRRIELPGVAVPVPRPVDIDQAKTGFSNLRTLRIYQFEAGSAIDGHAEEDEVFIVVLAGSINLTMIEDATVLGPTLLSAPKDADTVASVGYLPPHAAYKLAATSDADVAYVRATPAGGNPPKIFYSSNQLAASGVHLLIEETQYARRLRLRLIRFDAHKGDEVFDPCDEADAVNERLVHIRTIPTQGAVAAQGGASTPAQINSWDTLALPPGESLLLNVTKGSSIMVLVVAAS